MTVFEISVLAAFAVMMLATVIIAACAVSAMKKIAGSVNTAPAAAPAVPVRQHIDAGKNGVALISDTEASELAPAETEVTVPQGRLYLYGTTEREAAMIMAIVADQTKIPLNRLRFDKITKVEG